MADPSKKDITIIKTWDKIAHDFEIDYPIEKLDEEEHMILAIADRVHSLIRGNLELLMSHLYRLDVDERKIQTMLFGEMEEPVHIGIAKLIWDRQKMRIKTKEEYKQDPIEGWDFF